MANTIRFFNRQFLAAIKNPFAAGGAAPANYKVTFDYTQFRQAATVNMGNQAVDLAAQSNVRQTQQPQPSQNQSEWQLVRTDPTQTRIDLSLAAAPAPLI